MPFNMAEKHYKSNKDEDWFFNWVSSLGNQFLDIEGISTHQHSRTAWVFLGIDDFETSQKS